ncbi:hypothetical protein NKR19_g8730 [Coniochaeta hoffmannii]|uniref:Uncharacterized protein n=1 Tax=Coniochaeta hoffmannii TaxID=91930 RepID=A0AA38RAL4_9PEZI|nr:hypothetical protein NKR19_g8730 [Coniochaeta hoffmannii]
MSSATLYLALAMIWLFILSTVLLRSPKLRLILGDITMFLVRTFALTFGWIFVSVVYLPIMFFNLCNPFVPYDGSAELEKHRPKLKERKKFDLSIYKVSDYDFDKRFSPVLKKKDEGHGSGHSGKDSDSDWEKIEGN